MRALLAATVLVLNSLLGGCVSISPSRDILPNGWRLATEAAESTVVADLNGDGISDKAVLITNGDVTQVLVALSGKEGLSVSSLLTTRHYPSDNAISLHPAGK